MAAHTQVHHDFSTTDLALAAVFRTLLSETPVVHIGPRLAEFRFQVDTEEAQRLSDQFYGDKLSVNPHRFSEDLRVLKMMIHLARSGNGA